MDPQALQIMQTLGLDPAIMQTPQGQQLLQLLLTRMQQPAPQPGAQAPMPAPTNPMAALAGMNSAGADALRRTDPYAMVAA